MKNYLYNDNTAKVAGSSIQRYNANNIFFKYFMKKFIEIMDLCIGVALYRNYVLMYP